MQATAPAAAPATVPAAAARPAGLRQRRACRCEHRRVDGRPSGLRWNGLRWLDGGTERRVVASTGPRGSTPDQALANCVIQLHPVGLLWRASRLRLQSRRKNTALRRGVGVHIPHLARLLERHDHDRHRRDDDSPRPGPPASRQPHVVHLRHLLHVRDLRLHRRLVHHRPRHHAHPVRPRRLRHRRRLAGSQPASSSPRCDTLHTDRGIRRRVSPSRETEPKERSPLFAQLRAAALQRRAWDSNPRYPHGHT